MIPLLIVAAFDTYISLSLFHHLWIGIGALQILFLSQLWLFFFFFSSEAEDTTPFEGPLLQFAFLCMGMISFLFTFTALRDLSALVYTFFGSTASFYSQDARVIIIALSVASFVIGSLNARFRLVSPNVDIPVTDLPKELSGLRIVQLSDVHLGTGPKQKQVASMVDRALSLNPDLIALTGDIIDGMIADMQPELNELARLKAPHGVYFVLGNHECYWKYQDSIQALEKMGITVLLNRGVEKTIHGHPVFIAGVNDPAAAHVGGEKPIIPTPPTNSKLNILLVHQPQFAKQVSKLNYHLQLSGHTHGGQFFPWNLAVKKIYPISKGLGREQNLWVYVSQGTGHWGPPIRFGTSSEIAQLIMIPKLN